MITSFLGRNVSNCWQISPKIFEYRAKSKKKRIDFARKALLMPKDCRSLLIKKIMPNDQTKLSQMTK